VVLQPADRRLGVRAKDLERGNVAAHRVDMAHHRIERRAGAETLVVLEPGVAVGEMQEAVFGVLVGEHAAATSARLDLAPPVGPDPLPGFLERELERLVGERLASACVDHAIAVEQRSDEIAPGRIAGFADQARAMRLRQPPMLELADLAAGFVVPGAQVLGRAATKHRRARARWRCRSSPA
jgi:hypothetical protein